MNAANEVLSQIGRLWLTGSVTIWKILIDFEQKLTFCDFLIFM